MYITNKHFANVDGLVKKIKIIENTYFTILRNK